MREKLNNIIKRMQSGEKVNLYNENIEFLDYFKKDNNGISFIENCIKHNADFSQEHLIELSRYPEVIHIYLKYKKSLSSLNISEETLFSNYNGVRLIDYIIEKNALTSSIIKNINNIEIIDLLLNSYNTYFFKDLSDELIDNLIKPNSAGKYNIEKYFNHKNFDTLISSINKYQELIDLFIKTNRYDLLKYASTDLLLYKIGDITLLEDLLNKNILPKNLVNIPIKNNFITYLFENNYVDFLKEASESVLLTNINGKTILEHYIENDYIDKLDFCIYEIDTVKILYKYDKLKLINKLSESILKKNIQEVLEDETVEDIMLFEFLLDRNIIPIDDKSSINDKRIVSLLCKKGYYDFAVKIARNEGLLAEIYDNTTLLDKISKDKNVTKLNSFHSIEIANKLFTNGRFDLLPYGSLKTLLEKVESNNSYLDYVLEGIKNKTINYKVIDFTLYSLNVEELAQFYITLAKHDMMMYVKELEEDKLLKEYNGVRLIDKLLDMDIDLTINKVLSDEVREELQIATILKSRGIDVDNVKIPKKNVEYSKEYLRNFNNSLGIGPVYSLGETLLNRLQELFKIDGKSDLELIDTLVNAYKNALFIDYNTNIKEIMHLINIKENNMERFIYIREKEGAFFRPTTGAVHCDSPNYNTILHETGHALHYYLSDNKTPDNYLEVINKIKIESETLKKVESYSKKFWDIRQNVYSIAEKKYKDFFDKYYTDDKIKEIKEFLNKSLEEKKKKFSDLGFSEDVLDIILTYNFTVDEYIEQEKELYIKEYADSVLRSELGAFLSIGDILDAIYFGEFRSNILKNNEGNLIKATYGHGIPYYSNEIHGFDEMVANFAAISKSYDSKENLALLNAIIGDELYKMLSNFYYDYIINADMDLGNKRSL